jgi:hypothetical protein
MVNNITSRGERRITSRVNGVKDVVGNYNGE